MLYNNHINHLYPWLQSTAVLVPIGINLRMGWEGVDGTVLVAFFIFSFIFKSAIYLFYVENYTKGDNALQ